MILQLNEEFYTTARISERAGQLKKIQQEFKD
jgi:hypothetical protein